MFDEEAIKKLIEKQKQNLSELEDNFREYSTMDDGYEKNSLEKELLNLHKQAEDIDKEIDRIKTLQSKNLDSQEIPKSQNNELIEKMERDNDKFLKFVISEEENTLNNTKKDIQNQIDASYLQVAEKNYAKDSLVFAILQLIIKDREKKYEELDEIKNDMHNDFLLQRKKFLNELLTKDDFSFLKESENLKNASVNLRISIKNENLKIINELYKQLSELSEKINSQEKSKEQINIQRESYSRAKELNEEEKFSRTRLDDEKEEFGVDNSKDKDSEDYNIESKSSVKKTLKSFSKDDLEIFIGENLLNKLGVLFIIFGLIALSRYAFAYITVEFKAVIMFALSTGLLACGEYMNRKKTSIFSIGLTSAGVAGLYVSLFSSYFFFKILNILPAFFLCVLITTAVFALAFRYKSETITVFALIGGHLPLLALYISSSMTYSVMIYLVILNLLVVFISYKMDWKVTQNFGLVTNIISAIIMQGRLDSLHPFIKNVNILALFYILFSYSLYTFVYLINSKRHKRKFSTSDIILISINITISSFAMYKAFYDMQIESLTGALSIVFAIIYIVLAKMSEKLFEDEKNIQKLFYLLAFAFTALIVPFQFNKIWYSLAWIIQAMIFTVYGVFQEDDFVEKIGLTLASLCLIAFVFVDLLIFDIMSSEIMMRYAVITVCSILLALAYFKRDQGENSLSSFIINFALSNLYVFLLYISNRYLNMIYNQEGILTYSNISITYLKLCSAATITYLCSEIYGRIEEFESRFLQYFSKILFYVQFIAVIILSFMPMTDYSLYSGNLNIGVSILATFVLFAVSLMAVSSLKTIVEKMSENGKLSVDLIPFIVSVYALIIVTFNLMIQFDLIFSSVLISIIYLLAALAWIYYGFKKSIIYLRRNGLIFSFVATFKLIFIDFKAKDELYWVISLFIFAAIMLAISYVYNYFTNTYIEEDNFDENEENSFNDSDD